VQADSSCRKLDSQRRLISVELAVSSIDPKMSDTPAFDAISDEQVRSVGTAFLRIRPLLVAPAAVLALVITALGGGSREQLWVLSSLFGVVIGFFSFEAWQSRRATVTLSGFARSLALTVGLVGTVVWFTGAIDSPLLPVVFAPIVVGLAAFGRSTRSLLLVALFLSVLALLSFGVSLRPFPKYLPWQMRALTIGAFTLTLLLIGTGVVGLVDAHRRAGVELDRLRARALREATERTRQLETLSAKVAHEIRNPLLSIKGLVQLLARGGSGDRDQKRFQVVLSEVERLEGIVTDYLSFARPFDGLRLVSSVLDNVLREVASVVEAQAALQRVALVVEAEPVGLAVDENKLKQALLNLVTNALEATPAGGTIQLSARAAGGRAEIIVSDSGRGIPAAALARVGTPFFTTREQGTGLGLAIARGIVEQHGGELSIDSASGGGARVLISLPLAASAAQRGAS
jgi:two-component system sensor histidine kinase HydH